MAEATDEQYMKFGKVVTGIMDGYTFEGTGNPEHDNSALVKAIHLAAAVYGIKFQDPHNSERYGTKDV